MTGLLGEILRGAVLREAHPKPPQGNRMEPSDNQYRKAVKDFDRLVSLCANQGYDELWAELRLMPQDALAAIVYAQVLPEVPIAIARSLSSRCESNPGISALHA